MSSGILVCGLNGAGKSTFAKVLAEELNYRYIDIEDIYFPKNNFKEPYENPRAFEDVQTILRKIICENNNFVLASVKGDFNEAILSHFMCAVYIDTPKEIRLKRLYERLYFKYGKRMCEGGDLWEKEQAFLRFVSARDESLVERWLDTVSVPVIRVDGTLPIAAMIKVVIRELV